MISEVEVAGRASGAALVAITRAPSASLADCELCFLERTPIDLARARAQHAGYCAALRAAGAEVVVLPPLDALPDAVFVEDTAVVVDELAVLAVPGVQSRVAESEAILPTLARYRPVHRLARAGGTLEGGDVLRVGRTIYVGRSTRTSGAAIAELRDYLEPRGYRVVPVPVDGCLHLKTACTRIGSRTVLLNPAWVGASAFESSGLHVLAVHPDEPWASNTLLVGETLLVPAGTPATMEKLRAHGFQPREVNASEFQKAEAGLTCLSIVFPRLLGHAGSAAPASAASAPLV